MSKAGQTQDVEADARAIAATISGAAMLGDVGIFSADSFNGRRTGTPAALAAANWLMDQFQARGVTATLDTYSFIFADVTKQEVYRAAPGDIAKHEPMSYCGSTAPATYTLLWCGLGSAAEITAAKVAAKLPAGTPWVALIRRGVYNFGDKVIWAKAAGAAGALIFEKPVAEGGGGEAEIWFGTLLYDSTVTTSMVDIGALSLTRVDGLAILAAAGLTDTSAPGSTGVSVFMEVAAYAQESTGYNVWATITGESAPDKYVVIGAHYDHLGVSNTPGTDIIYNGANDNASGSVALLHIAQAMASYPNKPNKSVVFAAFSGEEDGLFGSTDFVAKHPDIVKNTQLMINLDEIGAGEIDKNGVPRSNIYIEDMPSNSKKSTLLLKSGGDKWAGALVYNTVSALVAHGLVTFGSTTPGPGGLSLGLSDYGMVDYIGRSGHEIFIGAGVPAVTMFSLADMSPYYHAVADEIGLIDPIKLEANTRVAAAAAFRVAEHSTQPSVPSDETHKSFPKKNRGPLVPTVEQ